LHRVDRRPAGFRVYQLGVLMWTCGGVLMAWSAANRVLGASTLAVGHSLSLGASGLFIGGLASVLFGLYKSLRASAGSVQVSDWR
jgi:hypothetical protein